MKSVGIPILTGALLLSLQCTPILASEAHSPGTGATAPAGLIVVDTVEDEMSTDGKCSLREAISAANATSASDYSDRASTSGPRTRPPA